MHSVLLQSKDSQISGEVRDRFSDVMKALLLDIFRHSLNKVFQSLHG